jgi:cell division protein FtsW (lipid II flippase)
VEGDGYIGGGIAGLVYFVAGYRMLRLSFKTKKSPERLLGAMFLFWSISYLFWYLGLALDQTPLVPR